MATTTLAALLNLLCDNYELGLRGTNTGTVATSLTDDATLGGYSGASGLEVGCTVVVTGGTRAGDIARLSSRPKLSTGLASVDPNFGGVLSATSTYVIFREGLRYTGGGGVLNSINAALAQFSWEKRLVPLTSVADGDMLASGVTSWSEVGDGAITKVAATFPLGHRVIRMTGVSADDYILSATIPVEPSTSYYLEALGMIASSGAAADTGTLILYDETNAANVTLTETTIDRFEPELLVNSVSTPSGCKQVSVRLEADNAGDIIDWGWIILRKNDQYRFVLPDRPQRILRVGQLRGMYADDWERYSWEAMSEVPHEVLQTDAGLWEMHLQASAAGMSLWYEEFIETPALSAVTDTTNVPDEELAAVAAELILRPMKSKSRIWAERYAKAAGAAIGVVDRYGELMSYVGRTQKRLAYRYS